MALLHRTLTARIRAANRANARHSTGPRSAAGKANSRLNALKHGEYSRLAQRYFYYWFSAWMCEPEEAERMNAEALPVPIDGTREWVRRSPEEMREFLSRVTRYLGPDPQAEKREAKKRILF